MPFFYKEKHWPEVDEMRVGVDRFPGEALTPFQRFVTPIDVGIARLRSRKALAAIDGVLSGIHER
jgi:hypothetical protein